MSSLAVTSDYEVSDSTIEELRTLALSEGADVFEVWKTDRATSDTEIESRHFTFKPILDRVLKRGVQVLPDVQRVTLSEDAGDTLQKNFNDWWEQKASMTGWENPEDNFWAALPYWRYQCRLEGDLYVKLPVVENVGVKPVRMDAIGVTWYSDGETMKGVESWEFSYKVNEEEVEEEISADKWTYNGEDQKMIKPGIMPLSHMVCEPLPDTPKGKPLALRLRDAFLDLLSAYLDIRAGNKLGAHQMLVAINNASEEAIPRRPGVTIEVGNDVPGMNVDVKTVGGDVSLDSLFKEQELAEKTLYELGYAPWKPKEAGGDASGSGRAQDRLAGDQLAFAQSYLTREQAFLTDLIWKMAQFEGLDFEKKLLNVEYAPLVTPDRDMQIKEAEVYQNADEWELFYRSMGLEQAEIDTRMKARADKAEQDRLNNQRPIPGVDDQDEDEDEDEDEGEE